MLREHRTPTAPELVEGIRQTGIEASSAWADKLQAAAAAGVYTPHEQQGTGPLHRPKGQKPA